MASGSNRIDFLKGAAGPGGGGGELVKATLTPLGIYLGKDPAKRGRFSEQDPITVLFNPKEFSLEKSIDWKFHPTAGVDGELVEFTGSGGETLSFQLFADTSVAGTDVRAFTELIRALTYPDEEMGHPRVVRFDWGDFTFKGFITKLVQKFTHHHRDGTPVRATLDVTIRELDLRPEKEPPNNETETEGRREGGGGGTERNTERRSESGVNESIGEAGGETGKAGGGAEAPAEAQAETNTETENATKAPKIELSHIWPGDGVVINADEHWANYHHSAVLLQLHVTNVKKVQITITPFLGANFSLYITGMWKQATPGKAAPKDGRFDDGGVGRTAPQEPSHTSRKEHKCHFWMEYGNQFGAEGHPSLHWSSLTGGSCNGPKVTKTLDYDKWVIALQPRKDGDFTVEVKGVGPYDVPDKMKPEDPVDQVVVIVGPWKNGD